MVMRFYIPHVVAKLKAHEVGVVILTPKTDFVRTTVWGASYHVDVIGLLTYLGDRLLIMC